MNNISSLPENVFSHLTSLQDLRLASNKLRNLPRKIFKMNYLLSNLYLQGNRFRSVPRGALQNLSQLQQLHLDANQINEVPANCFKNLRSLKRLWLDYNNLTSVPSKALASLVNLEALTLALNGITVIPNFAFANLSRLFVLLLHDNKIKEMGDYAFLGLHSLRILELNKNRLHQIPSSLSHLENLLELNIEENLIETLPDNSFSRNRKLSLIQLHKNPIRSIGTRAFSHLPSLEKIVLSEVTNMFTFPDLNGTNNLTQIRLDRASIQVVPSAICQHRPWLKSFDVHSNKITMIPDLRGCSMLLNLNLGNNQLLSLEGKPFQGLSQLRDLTLNHNKFNYIPGEAFVGLTKLQYLDLAHNQIRTIHPSAFLPLSFLEDLNLGDNKITALPTQGLQNLQKLKTFDNENLRDFPPKEAFPKVYNLVLNYAYHCCDFLQTATIPTDTVEMVDERVSWLGKEDGVAERWQEHYYNLTEFWTTHFDNHTPELWEDILNNQYDPNEYDFSKEAEIYLEDYEMGHGDVYVKNLVVAKPPVTCKPKPGPFMPCDDLFGWWSLRCGVWFVFMLALLGNAVVLFVSVSSRSKMDVPRFLICNLACADFCMGVYLGILAMVDASTLGEFRKHAIQWQISGGCLVAGFLGVLSSELSVFTLTVITLERFYAITHAMQLNKRLSLKQAGYIMLGGWLWSSSLASLPLFGISDYRKFAICLPFEVEDVISKSYVCFILVFNGLSFCVILACYLCMYLSIRHSQAWNSNDTRVAKRMALLVFTDFLCWAPIAFFSLAASFGKNLIDLSGAKVLTIFVLPLNSCANPFLYAIFTKQFKRDCVLLCRRLEDSSIARHFSRVSNRHVSFTWGSSRRPSQLHSLVNGEKGAGSCPHSMSGANAGALGAEHRNGNVGCHSDPDSGKGSLDYEKMSPGEGPCLHENCGCCDKEMLAGCCCRSSQVHDEMLVRCSSMQNGACNSGGGNDTCAWECRDCLLALQQHQQQQSHVTCSGSGGRTTSLSSYDYNCTTETYLPSSGTNHDPHDLCGLNGNHNNSCCQLQQQHRKDRKRRGRKELVMPVVSFSKAGVEHVAIHSLRGSHNSLCCQGNGEVSGCLAGALRCCSSSVASSPEETQRRHLDLPGPDSRALPSHVFRVSSHTEITVTQHHDDKVASQRQSYDQVTGDVFDVTRNDVMNKPYDDDSGHGVAIDGVSASRESSSTDDGMAGLGGGSGEAEGGEDEEVDAESPNEELGRNTRDSQGGEDGSVKAKSSGVSAVGQRTLDKSEHLRFFTDSLAAHPHACRSNSLVELTQTSQAKRTANVQQPVAKRLSLTPRQEGYHLDDNSIYLDDDEDPEFPSYEELQRYLHSNKHSKGRASATDRSAANQEEVCGLLDQGSKHRASAIQAGSSSSNQSDSKITCSSGGEKDSGFCSEL